MVEPSYLARWRGDRGSHCPRRNEDGATSERRRSGTQPFRPRASGTQVEDVVSHRNHRQRQHSRLQQTILYKHRLKTNCNLLKPNSDPKQRPNRPHRSSSNFQPSRPNRFFFSYFFWLPELPPTPTGASSGHEGRADWPARSLSCRSYFPIALRTIA